MLSKQTFNVDIRFEYEAKLTIKLPINDFPSSLSTDFYSANKVLSLCPREFIASSVYLIAYWADDVPDRIIFNESAYSLEF